MQYRFLGNTGLSLSCLGLGAMMFGGLTGSQESGATIQKAYELGINYFDTDSEKEPETKRLDAFRLDHAFSHA